MNLYDTLYYIIVTNIIQAGDMQTILSRDAWRKGRMPEGTHARQIIVIEGKFSKYDSYGLEKAAFLLEIS